MLAEKGVFRQNGSCPFCSRKRAWASRLVTGSGWGDFVGGGGDFLPRERPRDALEPILKTTSCLNGDGGVEKAFRGLKAGVSSRDNGGGDPASWPPLFR